MFAGIRGGDALRVSTFRKAFRPAAARIGVPDLYPHELRHTAASLAIASGADIKVVQQMLGHGSASMTLDTYGHLFENRLDEVADAMDLARTNDRGQRPPRARRCLLLPQCCPSMNGTEMRKTSWLASLLVRRSFSVVAPTGFEPALPP